MRTRKRVEQRLFFICFSLFPEGHLVPVADWPLWIEPVDAVEVAHHVVEVEEIRMAQATIDEGDGTVFFV